MSAIKLTADSGGGTVELKAPATTTGNAALQFKLPVVDGTSGQALTTNASGQLAFATVASGRKYTFGSWVNTTSGNNVEFTGLAATTELAFDWLNVKSAGNTNFQITIGDSGGYETSGYQTATGYAGASGNHHDPTGNLWLTEGSADAAGLRSGRMKLINMYGNWWHMQFDWTDTGSSPHFRFLRGTKELSGQLDRVKIGWENNGTFDGGYIRYVKIEDL